MATGDFTGVAGGVKAEDYLKDLSGVQEYIDQLEGLEFQFDQNDPVYKWRQQENQRQVNQFMAARGGYDSRAAANMLLQSGMQLQEQEVGRQFQQNYMSKYNKLMDLSNLTMGRAGAGYNMAMGIGGRRLDQSNILANIGANAAARTGQAGQAASNQLVNVSAINAQNQQNALLQQGAAMAGIGGAIGQAPLKYMIADKLFPSSSNWLKSK
jgi:hypothetical protein